MADIPATVLAPVVPIAQLELITFHGAKIERLNPLNGLQWLNDAQGVLRLGKHWTYVEPLDPLISGPPDPDHATAFVPLTSAESDAYWTLRILIGNEVLTGCTHLITPRALWAHCCAIIADKALAKQVLVLQELENKTWIPGQTMQSWISSITSKVSELQATGHVINSVSFTGYMLKRLPGEYSTAQKIANTYRNDVEKVKNVLLGEEINLEEEQRNEVATTALAHRHAMLITAGGRDTSKLECYYCGNLGHI